MSELKRVKLKCLLSEISLDNKNIVPRKFVMRLLALNPTDNKVKKLINAFTDKKEVRVTIEID